MAWPDGAEILSELPLAGKGVTEEETETRIRRWRLKLEYEPKDDRQRALAEEVVKTGAVGQMERLQLRRSGRLETPNADEQIKEANALLRAYNNMRITEGQEDEVAEDSNVAYIGRMPGRRSR